jgi:hypothetical protein
LLLLRQVALVLPPLTLRELPDHERAIAVPRVARPGPLVRRPTNRVFLGPVTVPPPVVEHALVPPPVAPPKLAVTVRFAAAPLSAVLVRGYVFFFFFFFE